MLMVQEINRREGTTVLLTTHYLEEADANGSGLHGVVRVTGHVGRCVLTTRNAAVTEDSHDTQKRSNPNRS